MNKDHVSASFAEIFGSGPDASLRSLDHVEDVTTTLNGRSAIYHLCKAISKSARRTVLVPAFHCPSVVTPVLAAGYDVEFFNVQEDLRLDHDDLMGRITTETAAVLVIDYFGFPEDLTAIRDACRSLSVPLVRDCSHSFLRADPLRLAGTQDDFAIYSFWKLVPCHKGGGLFVRDGRARPARATVRMSLRERLVNAKQIIEQAVVNLQEGPVRRTLLALETYRVAGRQSEASGPYEELDVNDVYPFDERAAGLRLPWLSRHVLETADLQSICGQRRTNYAQMASLIDDSDTTRPVFPTLEPSVCPWAFPVLLTGRAGKDRRLRDRGVPFFTFGEKLHPELEKRTSTDDETYRNAKYLSERMICFSIHQGLAVEEIRSSADTINETLGIDG